MDTLFGFLDEEDKNEEEKTQPKISESKREDSKPNINFGDDITMSTSGKVNYKGSTSPHSKNNKKEKTKPKKEKTKPKKEKTKPKDRKSNNIYIIIIVAFLLLLLVGGIFLFTNMSSDGFDMLVEDINISSTSLPFSEVSSEPSNANNFDITEIELDSDGWMFIWGKLSVSYADDTIINTIYYDKNGNVLQTSNDNISVAKEYASFDELMFSGCEVYNANNVDKITIKFIDSQSNVLNEKTYKINN